MGEPQRWEAGEGHAGALEGLRCLAADGDRVAARLLLAEALRRESLELLIEAEQGLLEPAEDWPGFSECGVSPQGYRELWHVHTGMVFIELPGAEPSPLVAKHAQHRAAQAAAPATLEPLLSEERNRRQAISFPTNRAYWLRGDFLPQRCLIAKTPLPLQVLQRFLIAAFKAPVWNVTQTVDPFTQFSRFFISDGDCSLLSNMLPGLLHWSGLQLAQGWQLEQVYAGSGITEEMGLSARSQVERAQPRVFRVDTSKWLSSQAWDQQAKWGLGALSLHARAERSDEELAFVPSTWGPLEYQVERLGEQPEMLQVDHLRLSRFAFGHQQLGLEGVELGPSSLAQLREQVALRLQQEYVELQRARDRLEQERQAAEAIRLEEAEREARSAELRRQRLPEQERRAPAPVAALLSWQRRYQSTDERARLAAAALARLSPELLVYGKERLGLDLGENRSGLGGGLCSALRRHLKALEPLRLLRAFPRDEGGRLVPGSKALLALYPHADGRGSSTLEAHSGEDGLLRLRLERRPEHSAASLPLGDYTLRFERERVYWHAGVSLQAEALWGFCPDKLAHAKSEFRSSYFGPGPRFQKLTAASPNGPSSNAMRCLAMLDEGRLVEAFCAFPVDLQAPVGMFAAMEVEAEGDEPDEQQAWVEGLQSVLRQCAPWRWHTSGHLHRPILGNQRVLTLHRVPGSCPRLSLQRYSPAHLLPLNWWKQPPELLMARYSDIDFASY